jgi:hypothetical protein
MQYLDIPKEFPCECCGYFTALNKEQECAICGWKYDSAVSIINATNVNDLTKYSALNSTTLFEAQQSFQVYGCCHISKLGLCRVPSASDHQSPDWVSVLDKAQKFFHTASEIYWAIDSAAKKLRVEPAEGMFRDFKRLYDVNVIANDEPKRDSFSIVQILSLVLRGLDKQRWYDILDEYYQKDLQYYFIWLAFLLSVTNFTRADQKIKSVFIDIKKKEFYGLLSLEKLSEQYWHVIESKAVTISLEYLQQILIKKNYIDWPMIMLAWHGNAPCGLEGFSFMKALDNRIITNYAQECLNDMDNSHPVFEAVCELANGFYLVDDEVTRNLEKIAEHELFDFQIAKRKWRLINVELILTQVAPDDEPIYSLPKLRRFWGKLNMPEGCVDLFDNVMSDMNSPGYFAVENYQRVLHLHKLWLEQEEKDIAYHMQFYKLFEVLTEIIITLDREQSEWIEHFDDYQERVCKALLQELEFEHVLDRIRMSYAGINFKGGFGDYFIWREDYDQRYQLNNLFAREKHQFMELLGE